VAEQRFEACLINTKFELYLNNKDPLTLFGMTFERSNQLGEAFLRLPWKTDLFENPDLSGVFSGCPEAEVSSFHDLEGLSVE